MGQRSKASQQKGNKAYKKSQNFKPRGFEHIDGKPTVSANIYADMAESDAWKALTPRAQVLYMYMKLQLYGQNPKPDGYDDDECFYFNKAMYMQHYGLYTNPSRFREDRDMLVKYGFIEVVFNGENVRKKNVYRFSPMWKAFTNHLAVTEM